MTTPPDSASGGPITGAVVCPQCGHPLSMYNEPDESPADTLAAKIADGIGSWRFLAALMMVIVVYVVVLVAMRPFAEDNAVLFNYLGVVLTVLVALQTPLILLTQRQETARDRARDREALRVATHTEVDLHAIRDALLGLNRPTDRGQD